MKLTNTQIECMIEDLSSEIIRILMEEWQYNMTQAMEIYYNSDTFEDRKSTRLNSSHNRESRMPSSA